MIEKKAILSRKKSSLTNKSEHQSSPSQLHDLLLPLKKQLEEEKVGHNPFVAPPADERKKRQDIIQHTLNWLYVTFPSCFNRTSPKPLKRRIEKDIYPHLPADQLISRLAIRRAIAFYTRWFKYRKALAESTHRYDLKGNPVEEIPLEHKERATVQLQEQQKRRHHLHQNAKNMKGLLARHPKKHARPKQKNVNKGEI
jgi:ProP effector